MGHPIAAPNAVTLVEVVGRRVAWLEGLFGGSDGGREARPVGAVAQLGERLVRNEEVSGSIPLSSTKDDFSR